MVGDPRLIALRAPLQVIVGQKKGQTTRVLSRCLWDTKSDNVAVLQVRPLSWSRPSRRRPRPQASSPPPSSAVRQQGHVRRPAGLWSVLRVIVIVTYAVAQCTHVR